jgi:hypothetical protein
MGTQLTKAQVDASLPDNSTGAIVPSNLRDLVESLTSSFGSMHFTDPGTPTTITTPATYVKAANTTVAQGLRKFTMPANNQLQYTGTTAVHGMVHATMSVSSAASNQLLDFAIYKNGIQVPESIMKTKVANAGDLQAVCVSVMLDINPGDYFELWVADETSAANLTVQHGYLSIMTMFE